MNSRTVDSSHTQAKDSSLQSRGSASHPRAWRLDQAVGMQQALEDLSLGCVPTFQEWTIGALMSPLLGFHFTLTSSSYPHFCFSLLE